MKKPAHFKDKDALSHVVEKRAEGVVALAESHGIEIPGMWAAFADALKESALLFLLGWAAIILIEAEHGAAFSVLLALSCGYLFWRTGRSAHLGWARLERLHREIEQEKYEIEHHRDQEREELTALYRAKGLEGKLLTDVIDVLMADQNRLLKVMLEEELGLVLEAHEHPLKQGVGAFFGVFLAATLALVLFWFFPVNGIPIASFTLLIGGGSVAAIFEKNRLIPTLVWNLSLGALALGVAFFVLKLLL